MTDKPEETVPLGAMQLMGKLMEARMKSTQSVTRQVEPFFYETEEYKQRMADIDNGIFTR